MFYSANVIFTAFYIREDSEINSGEGNTKNLFPKLDNKIALAESIWSQYSRTPESIE